MADSVTASENVSSIRFCDRCGHLTPRSGRCDCQSFECQNDWSPRGSPWSRPADEGNWHELYASDAEDAAEKFARASDNDGDYVIARNGSGRVWIRDCGGALTRWDIEAEPRVEYTATEAKP